MTISNKNFHETKFVSPDRFSLLSHLHKIVFSWSKLEWILHFGLSPFYWDWKSLNEVEFNYNFATAYRINPINENISYFYNFSYLNKYIYIFYHLQSKPKIKWILIIQVPKITLSAKKKKKTQNTKQNNNLKFGLFAI